MASVARSLGVGVRRVYQGRPTNGAMHGELPARVTGDSGHSRKSVTFKQNERSRSAGTAAHVQAESVVTLPRNTQRDVVGSTPRLKAAPQLNKTVPRQLSEEELIKRIATPTTDR
jgi:hypothetical protein